MPREVSQDSIATALALDGKLDDETREKFLEKVFSPAAAPSH
ncbi:hypothetical protein [Nonomuraea sp. NPDC049480]